MVEHKTGSLAVLDAAGAIVGIVTERDYLRKVLHEGRTSHDTLVGEIATMRDLQTCSPDDDLQHCVEIMDAKGFRHLPVKDGGEVVGLLSIKDIAHALAQRVQLHEDLKREQSLPPVHDG